TPLTRQHPKEAVGPTDAYHLNCPKCGEAIDLIPSKEAVTGLLDERDVERLIDVALHARVPGGAEVWAWLPQQDAWTPHETARGVMRAALTAAIAALTSPVDGDAPQGVGVAAWQPIETAPKDGTPILVFFKHGGGVMRVTWDSPHYDEVTPENGIWCVDDNKHGPYALRGYSEGDDTHWMPLPDAPDTLGKDNTPPANDEGEAK